MQTIIIHVVPVVSGHRASVTIDGEPLGIEHADTPHEAWAAAAQKVTAFAEAQAPPAPAPAPEPAPDPAP